MSQLVFTISNPVGPSLAKQKHHGVRCSIFWVFMTICCYWFLATVFRNTFLHQNSYLLWFKQLQPTNTFVGVKLYIAGFQWRDLHLFYSLQNRWCWIFRVLQGLFCSLLLSLSILGMTAIIIKESLRDKLPGEGYSATVQNL